MRRFLGNAWHPDAAATFRDVCDDARVRRGRFGYLWTVLAEITDLTTTAVRARLGHPTPITGGHVPPPPHKSGFTMQQLFDDLIGGWRRLARQPRASFGVIALLTLAIGVTSAMFTIVDAFIVRPAPYRDAGALSNLWIQGRGGRTDFALARALRDSGAFDAVLPVVINAMGEFKSATGVTTRTGSRITPGTFANLGVTPLLGREFVQGEGTEGNDDYVLLSEEAWRETFNADPSIAGKIIEVSGRPTVVVGVMPSGVRFPIQGKGIWRPLDLDRPPAKSASSQLVLYVRRPAGMQPSEAERVATEIAVQTQGPAAKAMSKALGSNIDDYSRESIISLAIGVGLVFVLLCANVTNLILARTSSRRSEFGVCTALGASRVRLLRQVLLENTAIGIVATMLGLGLAYGLVELANNTLPADLVWRTLNALDIDFRAVAATSAIGLLAVLLAGLPAAWLGTRTDVNQAIGQSRGGTDSSGSRRLTKGLLVLEVAMAVAVLASAGLHVRSFVNLSNADRGLEADRVLVATLTAPAAPGQSAVSSSVLARDIEDRLAVLPGIERVNRTSNVPPENGSLHFEFEIRTDVPDSAPVPVELMRSYNVGAGFFDTFGVRIVDGRGFEPTDTEHTVVLSEKLAQQLFGDMSPVGRSITLWKESQHIVGVAKEIRNSVTEPRLDHPEFYQFWSPAATAKTIRFGIRCAPVCASQESIRDAITSVSAGVAITSLRPLSEDFDTQLARPRTAAVVATAFSGLALLATAAGLYGVLAYAVSRRRREFGIRAALGAHPSDLRRMVLRDGLVVTLAGLCVGLGAGWALARWLASVQYGVTFLDPLTWSLVALTVVLVATVASWVPARTAMRVDPADMLRES
jgi:putative ABC transport system permease protein